MLLRTATHRIHGMLTLLLLVILVPMLLAQAYMLYHDFNLRRAREVQANREMAYAVRTAFLNYIQSILDQEALIATALTQQPSPSHAQITRLLVNTAKNTPAVNHFNWVDLQGRVRASSEENAIGLDISDRQHFRQILAGNAWYVSDRFIGRVTHASMITISSAVRDSRGRLIGVIMAAINPERLGEAVTIPWVHSGRIVIFDSLGTNVYRNRPSGIVRDAERYRLPASYLKTVHARGEMSGAFRSIADSRMLIGSTLSVPPLNWTIRASRPISEITAPLYRGIMLQSAIFLLVLSGALCLAVVLARRITVPLQRLEQHALVLADGHIDRRIYIKGFDEVEALCKSFNVLSEQLEYHERQHETLLASIERERAFLSTAIDVLPIPVFFLDRDFRVLKMNAALQREFETYDIHDWQQIEMRDPVTQRMAPLDERPIIRALHGITTRNMEAILALPQGPSRYWMLNCAPIIHNGEIVAAISACQDLTPLKEADQAKDHFLAMVSHELMTPITIIRNWTDIALESADPAMITQGLSVIRRNARRQERLVNDLLDMARMTHDKLDIQPERIDIAALARETAEEHRQEMEARNLIFEFVDSAQELPVMADPNRIQQVIHNLLVNARKFTEAGGRITVQVGCDAYAATISVRDTGRGIDSDQLTRIFLPFHQTQKENPHGGLGLGLALVKGIVEMHDGIIRADSDGPNQGSVFTITLPLAESIESLPIA